MALDEAILESVIREDSIPTVRVYSWDRPSVSLGRFQHAHRVLNDEVIQRHDIPVVKRLSGGKAVLHGHDITICVCASSSIMGEARGVVGSHLAITNGYVSGLDRLGMSTLASQISERQELVGPHANCFAASAAGDVTTSDGLKLLGGAQYRRGDCFMEQTSVPIAQCADALRGVLTDGIELPLTPLSQFGMEQIVQCLLDGLAEQMQIEWQPSEPTETELSLARQLSLEYEP